MTEGNSKQQAQSLCPTLSASVHSPLAGSHKQRISHRIRPILGTQCVLQMTVQSDIKKSRKYEMETYLGAMKALYENAIAQNGEIYDFAFELTHGFSSITASAIIADPRIIKILRYSIAPSISQMKFGQMFGISSVGVFEDAKGRLSSQLKRIAPQIATFATKHLDRARFGWLDDATLSIPVARDYARQWTCSIAADQNAQTSFRHWRKELQEQAILQFLISKGYVKSSLSGILTRSTDIAIGEYKQETRVRGRTTQKADVVFRSKRTKKLILIEAKAVGVELDATKRAKECCDKANDWRSSDELQPLDVICVIGGFFTETNLKNLVASGINIVWEHNLSMLKEYV